MKTRCAGASLFLLVATLLSCEPFLPPDQPPCVILSVTFDRICPEQEHRLGLCLRMRKEPLPENASIRFELRTEIPARGKGEETETLEAHLRTTRSIEPLDSRTGLLEVTFTSPFSFLPRDSLTLSGLTLVSLSSDGRTAWSGELIYPYTLEESISEAQ